MRLLQLATTVSPLFSQDQRRVGPLLALWMVALLPVHQGLLVRGLELLED